MEGIIRTRDLTRRFDALTAVDHLNLEVPRGEIFGLVGPDGAGKTTTLRMLCGLLDPSEGQAWVAGHDVVRETQAVKDSIGYMAQRFGLYADLTVDENMEFYADLFGIPIAERQRLLPELLRMTRMEPFRKRQAGKLSGGMKQKLGLMCTLLHRPEILFLDEPSNGVDPVSRRDFWAILYQLVKDGITVLVTTAYLDEAERCNRVGLMYQGADPMRCAGRRPSPDARGLLPGGGARSAGRARAAAPIRRGTLRRAFRRRAALVLEFRSHLPRRAAPQTGAGRPWSGGLSAYRTVARRCLHRAGAQGGEAMITCPTLHQPLCGAGSQVRA